MSEDRTNFGLWPGAPERQPAPGFTEWWQKRVRCMTAGDSLEDIAGEAWEAACKWQSESRAIQSANEWYATYGMPTDEEYREPPNEV